MSDQGSWGPPPGGGGAPPPPADEDYEPRDSSEDLTVPWSPALGRRIEAAHGAPPSAVSAGPAPAPPKKSKKGLILAGCGGCLGIVLSICCLSGYLLYLEEGVSYTDPGDEIESFPIAQGQPFDVSVTFDGTGYADVRAYVDVGASAPSTTTVSGLFDCSDYGVIEPAPVSETAYGHGDVPQGWVAMSRSWQYARSGQTVRCVGRLSSEPPAGAMRLVFTAKQRPSDWMSGI